MTHRSNWLIFAAALTTALALAFIAGVVYAADATITWTNPTQNTDGTAIPATGAGALTGTRVDYKLCSATTAPQAVTVPAPAASTVVTGLAPGTWCFTAFSTNNQSQTSVASNTAQKTIAAPPPVPNPPTIVTIETTAYEIQIRGNGEIVLGRNVGTLALGTPCGNGPITTAGSYYVVDPQAVEFSRTAKSALVVAKCQS
jgi:hypothetical protein